MCLYVCFIYVYSYIFISLLHFCLYEVRFTVLHAIRFPFSFFFFFFLFLEALTRRAFFIFASKGAYVSNNLTEEIKAAALQKLPEEREKVA